MVISYFYLKETGNNFRQNTYRALQFNEFVFDGKFYDIDI